MHPYQYYRRCTASAPRSTTKDGFIMDWITAPLDWLALFLHWIHPPLEAILEFVGAPVNMGTMLGAALALILLILLAGYLLFKACILIKEVFSSGPKGHKRLIKR